MRDSESSRIADFKRLNSSSSWPLAVLCLFELLKLSDEFRVLLKLSEEPSALERGPGRSLGRPYTVDISKVISMFSF